MNTAAAFNSQALPSRAEIEAADHLVKAVMPPTPQYSWPLLNKLAGTEVWVKHEDCTPVGAFKIRGGLTYMEHLVLAQPGTEGVVTATRGNHGQSVAFAAKRRGLGAMVVVPHGNSPAKNQAMRALGAELVEHGEDFQEALEYAARIARDRGWHPMPSFHRALVSGVATYSLEFLSTAPPLSKVYVPIGLGSGICGMLAVAAFLAPDMEVIGVVSAGAPAYKRSLEDGTTVSCPVTTQIADGVACRTPNDDALSAMRGRVSRVVEVSDTEVATAIRDIFNSTRHAIEGAGALGIAAAMKERDRIRGQRVGVVFTGANIDTDVFARILAGEDA